MTITHLVLSEGWVLHQLLFHIIGPKLVTGPEHITGQEFKPLYLRPKYVNCIYVHH
jgi:hypothetical protein